MQLVVVPEQVAQGEEQPMQVPLVASAKRPLGHVCTHSLVKDIR